MWALAAASWTTFWQSSALTSWGVEYTWLKWLSPRPRSPAPLSPQVITVEEAGHETLPPDRSRAAKSWLPSTGRWTTCWSPGICTAVIERAPVSVKPQPQTVPSDRTTRSDALPASICTAFAKVWTTVGEAPGPPEATGLPHSDMVPAEANAGVARIMPGPATTQSSAASPIILSVLMIDPFLPAADAPTMT